tara:strand:- start:270 stop:944 length:675 start_codon:yes stop_codon:yes gene_type:complete
MNPLNHVAIIMDGNGRWGIKKNKSRNAGHREGLNVVQKIIESSLKKEIKFLTLYAFSTENWKRPKKEINYLFKLLENFLKNEIKTLVNRKIKLKIIGKKSFSKDLNKLISKAENLTKNYNKLQVNLALNYGSKDEIVDTVKKINKKKIKINIKNINQNLYTQNIPDPDILIRTGNTRRLSNFLLWQLAYTEIFFVKKLWPDFNQSDFNKITKKYENLKRNFGSI